jgi:hypothetical protein
MRSTIGCAFFIGDAAELGSLTSGQKRMMPHQLSELWL